MGAVYVHIVSLLGRLHCWWSATAWRLAYECQLLWEGEGCAAREAGHLLFGNKKWLSLELYEFMIRFQGGSSGPGVGIWFCQDIGLGAQSLVGGGHM